VPAEGDDPLGAQLPGGQDAQQSDGAVADDSHRLARSGLGGDGGEPAGAEHVGGREQTRDQVVGRHLGGGDEGAVGQRDAGVLGLRAGGGAGLPVDAVGLVAGAADLAGVVGGEERADDELAGPDRADLAADLLDDADVLVAHRRGPVDGLDAAVGPQVRAAHAGGGQPDDGVGGLLDPRVRALLDADVAGGVQNGSSQDGAPSQDGWVSTPRNPLGRTRGGSGLWGVEARPPCRGEAT
jgi:hypothetical protein